MPVVEKGQPAATDSPQYPCGMRVRATLATHGGPSHYTTR